MWKKKQDYQSGTEGVLNFTDDVPHTYQNHHVHFVNFKDDLPWLLEDLAISKTDSSTRLLRGVCKIGYLKIITNSLCIFSSCMQIIWLKHNYILLLFESTQSKVRHTFINQNSTKPWLYFWRKSVSNFDIRKIKKISFAKTGLVILEMRWDIIDSSWNIPL